MTTANERTYRKLVNDRLEALTAAAVKALQAMLRKPLPPDSTRLDFEVHFHPLDEAPLPIVAYAMDDDDTMHGTAAHLLRRRVLTSKELAPFEAAGVETLELNAELLLAWFKRCWRAARGTKHRYAGTVRLHDSAWATDLRTLRESMER